MNKDPIQMVWVGDSISRLEYLCMRSFIANGHPVHLYTYSQIDRLPKDVLSFDANEIIPKEQIFLYKGSYALFADFFRWTLLALKGGYYCDTDMLCIRPFEFEEDSVIGKQSHDMINSAFLKFPPQHPIVLEMLDCALNPNKIKPYDTRRIKRKKILKKLFNNTKQIGWGETSGPPALTRAVNYMGQQANCSLKDFTYFYPVDCGNFNSLFDETLTGEKLYKNTYVVHLWNEMLRRGNIDKNKPFNPDSFVGQYFSLYCPEYDSL
ncbi:Mannosyltransferase OCH1 and related enzymes [Pasteurella testudinis DSM 23072]|uniref:Mannosyltransferase OCH1 and related enzymes n=1 Tax=Pasteurella testudinis DSM 23072 TaxID=1122938 RepID=A0A1W1UBT4_9PAST|nr:glycosyltransferase [Pasteurella testudinis]SMB78568.1 Mannosyltransferase OCH1 and related enzymes [Pasteurella testudinis DSM 23072]SUB52562.1 Mannosyltransferase OCH1 and related enzymes [Pasteurella testudinis]